MPKNAEHLTIEIQPQGWGDAAEIYVWDESDGTMIGHVHHDGAVRFESGRNTYKPTKSLDEFCEWLRTQPEFLEFV